MKTLTLILITFLILTGSQSIFDFESSSDISNWYILDDVVMGGKSEGDFHLNDQGHGIFSGYVSLENNGGFSSVRYRFKETDVDNFKKISIRLKGDGKRYQFRVKSDKNDRHSYITFIETSGEWETIEINLDEMYPSWRGMRLDIPNYEGKLLEEIAFLISNKKAEYFKLEIDNIVLK